MSVHVRLMGIKAPDTKASTALNTNKQGEKTALAVQVAHLRAVY
jgi:predicted component of type VI protein secretion system